MNVIINLIILVIEVKIELFYMEIKSKNELIVLSLLANIGRELYGYEMVKELKEYDFHLLLGSLYNTLDKLEKKSFIKSEWRMIDVKNGKRERKYYEISAQGQEIFEELKRSLMPLWGIELAR